jgi:hypothetical protein
MTAIVGINLGMVGTYVTYPHRLYFALKLVRPDGVTNWWALRPLASGTVAVGYIKGRMLTLSDIPRSIMNRNNELESGEVTAVIEDGQDREFSKFIEGPYGSRVKVCVATVWLCHENSTAPNWSEQFVGVLNKVNRRAPLEYELKFGFNDRDLKKAPPLVFTRTMTPNAADDVIGQTPPRPYNKLSSIAQGENGFCKGMLIDKNLQRYCFAWGIIKAITNLYDEGKLLDSSQWSRINVLYDGWMLTCVDINSSYIPTGVITADLEGYAVDGDGAGALIVNPTSMMEHYLRNFGAFGTYRNGTNWLTSTVIQTEYLTDALNFENIHGYLEKGRFISGNDSALTVINSWGRSLQAHIGWSRKGYLIVAYPWNHPQNSFTRIRASLNELGGQAGSFKIFDESEGAMDQINVDFAFGEGGARQSLIVAEPYTNLRTTQQIDAEWSPSSIV